MAVPPDSVGGLSRGEKQELLRRILVEKISRTRTEPASFAQERLWFLDRLQPADASYNLPAALRLRGVIDAAALERALGEVVRRHEALRTTFAEQDGAPVQVIAPYGGFALPVENLPGLNEAGREAAARRLAAEDAARRGGCRRRSPAPAGPGTTAAPGRRRAAAARRAPPAPPAGAPAPPRGAARRPARPAPPRWDAR
ncbi:MAG: condensation domain-containing protein, partial [Longimicrobiaceae bacterium]